MATLTTQEVTLGGLNPVQTAASAGGDKFTPSNDTYVRIRNTDASPKTVTFVTPREAVPGVAEADVAIVVPAGEDRLVGPFPAGTFGDPTDGLVHVTYSAVTSVTLGVFRLGEIHG
jgi:hypothetical protein